MTTTIWKFSALDTLFFRGAVPFNAGEGGQGGQTSMFPPAISTIQGAIRYQLAVSQGWRPPSTLPAELGDGDSLGQLKLRGPYLLVNDELLFPCPLFLVRQQQQHAQGTQVTYYRLSPGQETVQCDLGNVRLPLMPAGVRGAKPMENYWLNASAMTRVLAGGVPYSHSIEVNASDSTGPNHSGVYDSKHLWEYEPKVGIGRDSGKRTAEDKNLYAINMVRPMKEVSIAVAVEGLGNEWFQRLESKPNLINLGGEGKLAAMEITRRAISLPDLPELEIEHGRVRFTVTLITPAYFGNREETIQVISNLKPWINCECVTACISKAIQIGGWDLAQQRPRPLRSYIPAGSTWFFEGDAAQIDAIKGLHGSLIGEETSQAYGYGQILIGRWRCE